MIIQLIRVKKDSFKYYLKADDQYIVDDRFIFSHPQEGKEGLLRLKEIIQKFGEFDFKTGIIENIEEEVVCDEISVNIGDNLNIVTKISGRIMAKK